MITKDTLKYLVEIKIIIKTFTTIKIVKISCAYFN